MFLRFMQFLLVGCFLAIPAAAQRGGGFHGGMGGFRGGMGGFHAGMGGFHGGGYAGSGFRGGFAHGGFVHGYGGFRGYHGYYPSNRFVFGFGYPYWPYYGRGWYSYYSYTYYPLGVSYPYLNEYPNYGYAYPYNGADQSSCPQANGKPLYLIKLTYTNNIWVTQDYWYTADTLNFITVQGEQNKTPSDSIDRATTFQLNRDCGVNFQLPR